MITRRIQSAVFRALTSYRFDSAHGKYNPISNALTNLPDNGAYVDAWVPDLALLTSKIYAEKPPDNLRRHPFICIHNSMHPVVSHTGDVEVVDVNGENPESYPGHTCWMGEWVVYVEDKSETAARADRIRELVDAAMEFAISRDSMDYSLPGEELVSIPDRLKPFPPKVRQLLFRRMGLTQPYDEWYDGRRYWWRGLRYDIMLEEEEPMHSSLR